MEKLITLSESHFKELNDKLDFIMQHIAKGEGINGWLDEESVKRLLKKKTTALWEMRRDGKVTFSKINGKIYYLEKSILAILEKTR